MKKILLFIALIFSTLVFSQKESLYKIVNTIHLPGDGSWDYISIDSKGILYVSHGNEVHFVNSKDGKLLGSMGKLNGVHGIALAENLNKGFISCGKDTAVYVFDMGTFQLLEKIKVSGVNPDAILFDSYSNQVFVFNGKTANATVIDAQTHKISGTIALEGKPEFSVSDGKGKVYVNIEDKSLLTCIDSKQMKVMKSWSIAPGEEPSGLAADFENEKLFIVCGNKKMVVFDLKKEKVAETFSIGDRTDGAAYDKIIHRAYSSNGDGTLTVVEEKENICKMLENFPTKMGARTLCVDINTHHIFLPTAEFETSTQKEKRPKIKPGSFMILEIAPIIKQ